MVHVAHEWLKTHDKRDDYYTGDFAQHVLDQDAVIQEQTAQIAELRTALKHALDMAAEHDLMSEPGGWKRIDSYNERLATLRKLVGP